jgi:hypothetical protein
MCRRTSPPRSSPTTASATASRQPPGTSGRPTSSASRPSSRRSIDKGAEVAGFLRSLSETGLQIGQDAASTLPGGALISAALAGLGGLFLRRPGDANRERLEKEASYRAGLEKGQKLAEAAVDAVSIIKKAETPPEHWEG